LFTSSTTIRRRPDGLYTIAGPRSKLTAGLVGNQLVVGKGSVGPLRSFARAPTTVVNGARGAVAFRLRVADLVRLATHGRPSRLQQTILGLVGELTGWSADSPSALTGSAALAIR
jgi:hypothetical protein